jgi:hypothetical protein
MLLRTTALRTTAAAAIAAAGLLFGSPAASAATPGSVQVTGNQLKSALLPASYFGSGYAGSGAFSTGGHLEPGPALYTPAKLSCADFWGLFDAIGYGETALASGSEQYLSGPLQNLDQALYYTQAVYQLPGSRAATALYDAEYAKYAACRSFTVSGGHGQSVHVEQSVSKTHVDGHPAFLVTQNEVFSETSGSLKPYMLIAVDGADIFLVQASDPAGKVPASPSDATVIAKLITRVAALR